MAFRSRAVTVTTSATSFADGSDQDFNPNYRDVAVSNTSSVTIYIGGPDVTTVNGFPLAAGSSISFDHLPTDATPFAVVATGTATLAVLELGV